METQDKKMTPQEALNVGGVTQYAMAKHLGLTQNAVWTWCKRGVHPEDGHARDAFADKCGVPRDAILWGKVREKQSA